MFFSGLLNFLNLEQLFYDSKINDDLILLFLFSLTSFRKCLLGVNDTISTMVGYSFFNILRVPCFELKEQQQCTKMYWWGM